MLLGVFVYLVLLRVGSSQVVYDSFSGVPLNDTRRNDLASIINATLLCTQRVDPCRDNEGRRIDGTCTNPRFPSRGAGRTPLLRMLPARYGPGNSLRRAKNGSELPSTRLIRTKVLSEGYAETLHFSLLLTHVFVFSFVDVVDLTYLLRFVILSDCCLGNTPNRINPICIPIPVPVDDPILMGTGVRCQNLTRQETFQERGCLPNTVPAERFSRSTPLLDLSIIYGNTEERSRQIRLFEGGLLRFERRDDREIPPGNQVTCLTNRLPLENTCYDFGDPLNGNLLTGIVSTGLLFFREHNRIARRLATLNPCWDDQKLFESARQINIAQFQYIMYYELWTLLLGKKNSLTEKIIYDTLGHVDDFDESYVPGVFHEYVVGNRYYHTLQDGRFDLYSNSGDYLGTRRTVFDSMRSGIFENNNTEADLAQGSFRQRAAKIDYIIDYDFVERLFGGLQRSADLSAIDIQRSRDQGLPPYNAYRKICGLPTAYKFEDFEDVIYVDKVRQLKRTYASVDDVDVMAAIYSERLLPGLFIGPTLYCMSVVNLLNWRKSDRFFFEHSKYFNAFTTGQLYQIRQQSIARIMCDSGDKVDRIQPRAMLRISKHNPITPCEKIPRMDLTKWTDPVCYPQDLSSDLRTDFRKDGPPDIRVYDPRPLHLTQSKRKDFRRAGLLPVTYSDMPYDLIRGPVEQASGRIPARFSDINQAPFDWTQSSYYGKKK